LRAASVTEMVLSMRPHSFPLLPSRGSLSKAGI
jgi:hypothetical protein